MDHRALRGRPEDVPEEDAWQYFGIYMGQAIHLARELRDLRWEDIAGRLTAKLTREVSVVEVRGIESAEIPLSWHMLVLLSEVLTMTPHEVIAMAERLLIRENRAEGDIITDILGES